MFTGIVETFGTIRAVEHFGEGSRIEIGMERTADLVLGESVAINGVCLTVAAVSPVGWSADVSVETLGRSTLGELRRDDVVHVERALRVGDRLGGHFVQGHVDEVGTLRSLTPAGDGYWMEVEVSERNTCYLVEKGSVAVDGVSLTVAALTRNRFRVALIPYTLEKTTFRRRRIGSHVNIEFDILAKYIERLTRGREVESDGRIDRAFLEQHGYLR